MYIIVIAWLYVAVMMAAAEATHVNGGILSAVFTFIGYGLLPVGLVIYVMQSPARKKRRQALEAAEAAEAAETAAKTPSETSEHANKEP
jgi:predicted membrane channel-forming protein YqfA (hemolysin III family)